MIYLGRVWLWSVLGTSLAACGADTAPALGGASTSSSSSSTSSSSSSSSSASSTSSTSSSSSGGLGFSADEGPALCAFSGAIESEYSGFGGLGYINAANALAQGALWQVLASSARETLLTIRYANGSGSARPAQLSVNGGQTQVEYVDFAAGDSWRDWHELQVNIFLEAGDNRIELLSESASGLPNVDALQLAGAGISAGNCAVAPTDPVSQGSPYSITGTTDIHDPSTIVKDGDTYWTFGTGGGAASFPINALSSKDLRSWRRGPSPIARNTYPSWIDSKVPGFDGNFWAPDVIAIDGKFYLYYSAFARAPDMRSAIGVMVTDSLNNPNWRDLGPLVTTVDEPLSSRGEPVNTIDAGLYRDSSDRIWMIYGSHYAGIFIREIDPRTGLLLGNQRYNAAGNNGAWNEYEAAQVQYLNGFYYLFINLGDCCVGRASDYAIFVGRSSSPTGPFLSRTGRDLWQGDLLSQQAIDNGSTDGALLATQGVFIGPGHFGYLNHRGQHLASIHHYDGTTADGWPGRLRLLGMSFEGDWPQLSYDFLLRE